MPSYSTECKLQSECFIWHWNNFPEQRGLLFMNHNTPKDARNGAILKGMGLVKGVADMTYLSDFGAILIEFKTEEGKQSKDQKEWQKIVEYAGYKYVIVRSLKHFQNLVTSPYPHSPE